MDCSIANHAGRAQDGLMRGILAVVMLVSGCANVHVNRATLIASSLALACDGLQTIRMADTGWTTTYEMNPLLGETPDGGVVGAYFTTAIALNAALWLVMPERYRSVAPVAITAMQATLIRDNMRVGTGLCGF
jgi:hypothetical protein